uniref:Uncharacterized protein n=1 Tax=Odontella aurita TaxID=265563 RepID=A0A7S4N5K4_9STRA|mmetsp:Transcript_47744/g.144368  ORF Transcript_47744/g.144368 Transcript_47744/m.144368 type:complete len:1047 (+) Transcript_47744:158-3298(+)
MAAPDAPAATPRAPSNASRRRTNDDDKCPPASTVSAVDPPSHESVERTYASLIQSYLSVLCHDNATFLAERMAAHSPRSPRAHYLLAVCHYRGGSPNRARSVLSGFFGTGGGGGGGGGGGFIDDVYGGDIGGRESRDDDENDEEENFPSAMSYLLARCCLDLGRYGEAEDALLRSTRERFQREGASTAHLAATEDGGASAWAGLKEMDRWVLMTSPCPVPNGAAGLNLLGTVCRRTNRGRRAVDYYRMSLKLDPMMWSSYEALCEMGAASSEEDDPTKVFGVVPASLQRIESAAGSVGGEDILPSGAVPSPAFSLSGTPLGAESEEPRAVGGRRGVAGGHGGANSAIRHRSFATPTSPDHVEDPSYTFLGGGGRDGGGSRGDRGVSVGSGLHATSLFHTGGRSNRVGNAAAAPAEPSASLFDTPGLTPIRRSWDNNHHPPPCPGTVQRGAANPPSARGGGGGDHHPHDDSAQITNSAMARAAAGRPSMGVSGAAFASPEEAVVNRARTVAARLYYGPSPETTPPPTTASKAPPPASSLRLSRARKWRRRRLGGLTAGLPGGAGAAGGTPGSYGLGDDVPPDAAEQSRLSFSSSSAGGGAGGIGGPSAADLSTPFGEKRALFQQSSARGRAASGGRGEMDASTTSFGTTNNTPAMRGLTLGGPSPSVSARAETLAEGGGRTTGVAGGGARNNPRSEPAAVDIDEEGTDEDGGVREILELLCTLGAAQRQLCQYRCQDALQIFHQLPHSQFDTGWVQHQVGRAHFEMADYHSAQRALEAMHRAEPHRMKGLEVLSTALWHLKKEVELSHLAQTAVDFDRHAPESWCVVGNCFSLHKEHETALTFFRRSVRLDPTFTYSHTLSGHEYVANEDFDKAVQCYRDALRSDGRHYNAWYGLGAIYYRQEKYDLAEYHFRRALSVNPQSSVLHCHLGMALHANGKPYEALDALAGAFRLDPRNPQARYQRATIWMSVDRPAEALTELERVRDAAPREASVHFAMGRVLKRLGRPDRAMRCFLTALDLDPKDNNLIKAAMDRLDEPDVDEDVSAF